MSYKLQMQACLACGHKMNLHAQVAESGDKDAQPEPDDITLCIRCGCVMAYDDELHFRHLTPEEHDVIRQDERVQLALAAIGRLHQTPSRQ